VSYFLTEDKWAINISFIFHLSQLAIPMALFYVNNQGDVLPIAIQLFQDGAEDNPVMF
jgi:hypothetical protein